MNSVNLTGRWTKDVECKTVPSKKKDGEGFVTARGTLAVQSRETNADGEFIAYYIEVTAIGKTAELMGNYGTKGKLMGVTGHLKSRKYDLEQDVKGIYKDKVGKEHEVTVKAKVTHYVTEVVAQEISFLEKKSAGSNTNKDERPLDSFDTELTPVDDGDIPF